jgi:hypothetical protein
VGVWCSLEMSHFRLGYSRIVAESGIHPVTGTNSILKTNSVIINAFYKIRHRQFAIARLWYERIATPVKMLG